MNTDPHIKIDHRMVTSLLADAPPEFLFTPAGKAAMKVLGLTHTDRVDMLLDRLEKMDPPKGFFDSPIGQAIGGLVHTHYAELKERHYDQRNASEQNRTRNQHEHGDILSTYVDKGYLTADQKEQLLSHTPEELEAEMPLLEVCEIRKAKPAENSKLFQQILDAGRKAANRARPVSDKQAPIMPGAVVGQTNRDINMKRHHRQLDSYVRKGFLEKTQAQELITHHPARMNEEMKLLEVCDMRTVTRPLKDSHFQNVLKQGQAFEQSDRFAAAALNERASRSPNNVQTFKAVQPGKKPFSGR